MNTKTNIGMINNMYMVSAMNNNTASTKTYTTTATSYLGIVTQTPETHSA